MASPNELARLLGERLGNVSYHVRVLCELGCLELVRTEPRRGALEHYYRATARPWLDDEQWEQLAASVRRESRGHTLSAILEQASKASREHDFESPETHVSRIPLALDEQAMTELTALLTQTLEAARRLHAESTSRHAPDAPPVTTSELAIIHFRPAETQ